MTESISIEKLYSFYKETINYCSLLNFSSDITEAEYALFEEFEIGGFTFLHKDALTKLHNNGFITIDELDKASELRNKMLELQRSKRWNKLAFQSAKMWYSFLKLGDNLKLLNEKNEI